MDSYEGLLSLLKTEYLSQGINHALWDEVRIRMDKIQIAPQEYKSTS